MTDIADASDSRTPQRAAGLDPTADQVAWEALQHLASRPVRSVLTCVDSDTHPVPMPVEISDFLGPLTVKGHFRFADIAPDHVGVAKAAFARSAGTVGATSSVELIATPGKLVFVVFVNLQRRLGVTVVVEAPQNDRSNRIGPARTSIQLVNEVAQIVHLDAASFEILGWDESWVGKATIDFIHPADHEQSVSAWIEMLTVPGAGRPMRQRYRHANGEWIWVEIINRNRLEQLGYVEREVVDISSEMDAVTTARLREEVLRRLGAALPSGIAEFDANWKRVYSNSRLFELTGIEADSIEPYLELMTDTTALTTKTAIDTVREEGELVIAVSLTPRGGGATARCNLTVQTLHDGDNAESVVGHIVCLDDISASWELQRSLAHQASHDALTGLPNRAHIVERIGRAMEQAEPGAVMFFDLDNFKEINDVYGHSIGDEILVRVSESLAAAARSTDFVGRLGGDEFVVICPLVADDEGAIDLGQRFLDAVGEPISLGPASVRLSASCGITMGRTGAASERILAEADIAMYEQKREGSNQPGLFRAELFAAQRVELERAMSLQAASTDGSLEAWFQPLVTIETGAMIGHEALVRWRHDGQLLLPVEFIALAERRGEIQHIGRWMIDRVVAAAAASNDRSLRWTINVSPLQLRDESIISHIAAALDRHDVAAHQIGLELTEGLMLANSAKSRTVMKALDELGVMLIVDDFGTGFASLSYLREYPIGGIKVDRAFTADLSDERTRLMIQHIITLSKDLDLLLVVEGIETADAADRLFEMGAELGQGYLYGRPEPFPP